MMTFGLLVYGIKEVIFTLNVRIDPKMKATQSD